MELDYTLMDPTGNVTVVVRSPVPEERQPDVALALMAAEPAAEQVGFLSPGGTDADVALRMAGGEFCGNAAMCAAVLRAAAQGTRRGEVRVRVSGAPRPIRVSLAAQADGAWLCGALLPACPAAEQVTLPLNGAQQVFPLLRMDGIAHLILSGDPDRELVARAAPDWCAELGAPALGCMLLDEAAGRLTPLVYVPGAQTLYWERSCASGSAAVGAYLAQRRGAPVAVKLAQPGGTLYVESDPVGKILLRGVVRELKVGKFFVK